MSNRLARESSLYLRQHADNPVDWHPWDEQALEAARRTGKPVLLSIGYSACHWCHVMAHESFEDPDVAQVMNALFVNIKVDREERPDLDRVYQLAHQLLTQRGGGWPLTVFLDPETLVPFFAGTYFPKDPRYRLPGFADVLRRVAEVYDTRRDELRDQGGRLAEVLKSLDAPEAAGTADQALLDAARDELAASYDAAHGGFGHAPKFPMPATLDRLLRHWAAGRRDRQALDMVMTTLTAMARGGIRDHLGGGFCRYATDARWMIPHFEKMLYDNGQLLALYSDALAVGRDALFEQAVSETVEWLLREMRHPGGAFYAALDADSEGEEGRYYVWRRDEVKRLLDDDEHLVVETLYGLDKPANFEGRWHLHRYDAWRAVVERLSLAPERAEALLRSAREKLLAARERRVRPARDDKILTAWNGLAITGLAKASLRLDRPDWLTAAQQAADFLREHVYVGGRLYATWQRLPAGAGAAGQDVAAPSAAGEAAAAGGPRFPGYLDDYAFLLQGLSTLLGVAWRDRDLAFARTLAEALLEHFEDREAGGFFFTAHDHEPLIHRPKPVQDDAVPPGNAVAALALADLGHLLGEPRYLEAAAGAVRWARGLMEQHPGAHCAMLTALEAQLDAPEQVVVRGPEEALGPWLAAARAGSHPGRRVYGIPADAAEAPDYLPPGGAGIVAYRCEGAACSAPITSLDDLKAALRSR